jgi:hypothetical protein
MAIDVLEQTTSRRVAAVVFLRSIVTQEEITWQKKHHLLLGQDGA